MFTGIVEAIGKVLCIQEMPIGRKIFIHLLPLLNKIKQGDSVAINGTCLTVTDINLSGICFDVISETLRCTNLGQLEQNNTINLETSLTLQKPLGGHIVQGHVDGIGVIKKIKSEGNAKLLTIQFPSKLKPYLAKKGFIAVDGMSLTIIDVLKDTFTIILIPHTQQATIAGSYQVSQKVNLEGDILAKYVENQIIQGTYHGTHKLY